MRDDGYLTRYLIYRTVRTSRWQKRSKPTGHDTVTMWVVLGTLSEGFWYFLFWCSRGTPLLWFFGWLMVITGVTALAGIVQSLKGRH